MEIKVTNLKTKEVKKDNVPQNTYKVDNGKLFINNIYVGIVEIIPKVNFDEHIYNVEEKILARQENI